MALRGPSRSIHRPNTAAEIPRTPIAREKIQGIEGCAQSPGAACVTPIKRVRGTLKTLKAYTWPIERFTAHAAGGISHRLNPGSAIECSRSRNERSAMSFPVLVGVVASKKLVRFRVDADWRPIDRFDASHARGLVA